jgi:hypothetical protein
VTVDLLQIRSSAYVNCRLPHEANGPVRTQLEDWVWRQVLGTDSGESQALPLGVAPPKAGLCTLLFNPIYKFVLIKNTKVAGTSVFLNFGGHCPDGITLEEAKVCRAGGSRFIASSAVTLHRSALYL